MLARWNGKLIAVSFLLNLIPLGLPHITKGRLGNMAKSRGKVNSTLATCLRGLFNKSPAERHAKREFRTLVLTRIKLKNYLNQKMRAAINIADGSTLRDNLITGHQVDYQTSVLIPAEAVENDQEHIS